MKAPQPLEVIGKAALSNAGDFRTSYELAARCIREGIPGDFVECGVFGGSQCAAMAKALMETPGPDRVIHLPLTRRVHLFDSFEGVPEPGPEDRTFVAGGNGKGTSACSLETVQSHMRDWGIPEELLVYHRGWFTSKPDGVRGFMTGSYCQVVAKEYAAGPFSVALLRVDLDLYEGTLAALELLYPLLSPRGFCVIDDYALDGCRQAVNEYMGGGFPPITWQKP